MKFRVLAKDKGSLARVGELETVHGKVETPVFMPVATTGVVKTLAPWELEELGASIILGNTYHLHLRPGEKTIAEAGGLHEWMKWRRPILTDSGGYQAFSLGITKGRLAKTTDEGVRFYSHLDGKKLLFTPESVIDIQSNLGSDIVMVLDDCAPYPASVKRLKEAVRRNTDWAKRSSDYWFNKKVEGRGLFGIVQGGMNKILRLESLKAVQALPFDGIAIGGVSVGEGREKMIKTVDYVAGSLDPDRPHYLMGVGEPVDLISMVNRGIDMFDCVLPTRLARHGSFWTSDFRRLNITNATYATDSGSLDKNCRCRMCRTFSRRYVRHLYLSGESLSGRILSYHNLWLLLDLMRKIRRAIVDGDFKKKFTKYLKD